MVEIVDRDLASPSGIERRDGGAAARLVREAGARRPEDRCVADRAKVKVVSRAGHVRRLRLAVEVERVPVRGEDLVEQERLPQGGVGSDPAPVVPEIDWAPAPRLPGR